MACLQIEAVMSSREDIEAPELQLERLRKAPCIALAG